MVNSVLPCEQAPAIGQAVKRRIIKAGNEAAVSSHQRYRLKRLALILSVLIRLRKPCENLSAAHRGVQSVRPTGDAGRFACAIGTL